MYNKSIFFHLNPHALTIHIYELDPTFSYKNQHAISLWQADALYQLQVVDNMLVVHDLRGRMSQLYDLKLPDYATGVLKKPVHIAG